MESQRDNQSNILSLQQQNNQQQAQMNGQQRQLSQQQQQIDDLTATAATKSDVDELRSELLSKIEEGKGGGFFSRR